jgi:nitrite reductase (cytochrome c-552)
MVWASTIAAIKETFPYGAGCNHCHDPHTGGERLVRKAMLAAIEGDGGPSGSGGVNPYREGSAKQWTNASKKDRHVLMCAQCHVEYVCGKSGVDGIDRDFFSWSKATDLHDVYSARFDYSQDWRHALMGEPLIKSQHPETELYWESPHYDVGATCSDCHMPQVRDARGRTFRSHWFTSPYKYRDEKTWTAFAENTGVRADPTGNPCVRCHSDRTEDGIAQQRAFFQRQAEIEKLLAASVAEFEKLKVAKTAKKSVDESAYARALEAHRRAHVIWENLAVSENSMGFHNFGEAMSALDEAEKQVRDAIESSKKALTSR